MAQNYIGLLDLDEERKGCWEGREIILVLFYAPAEGKDLGTFPPGSLHWRQGRVSCKEQSQGGPKRYWEARSLWQERKCFRWAL